MPTYLLHGFRWPRPLIRVHIIISNIDGAAPEWLIAPGSTEALLDNFHEQYPDIMENLPNLRFVEQYDPLELVKGQPFAYVADIVHEVKLGVDIDEIRGQGVPNPQWSALVDLRDKLCPDQKMAWYVVVCGDVNRFWEDADSQILPANNAALAEKAGKKNGRKWKLNGFNQSNGSRDWSVSGVGRDTPSNYGRDDMVVSPSARAKRSGSISRLKKIFGGGSTSSNNGDKALKKSKSEKNLRRPNTSSGASGVNPQSPNSYHMSPSPPPPLPGSAY